MSAENNLKNAGKACLLLLVLLLAGALAWYRERMLFGDAAWIAFLIINKKTLMIQEHRYGSFITQVFPLAGTWLRLPLSWILLLYSASFNLFYLGVGALLYRMRQYRWLILLCFYLTLIVSVNYFWPNNEVHQGITWMFLLFGYISYIGPQSQSSGWQYLFFCLLAFLAVFTHPLVILVTGFLWVYLLLAQQHPLRKDKRLLPFSLILCLLIGLKYYISTQGWYDGDKIRHITSSPGQDILILLKSKTASDFFLACLTNYWILILFFFTGIFLLLQQKKWLLVAWALFCAWAYMTLICMINKDNRLYFYTESEWMSLSIIITFPLITQIHLYAEKSGRFIWILAAIFCIRLFYIAFSLSPFATRYAALVQLTTELQKKQLHKVILKRPEEHTAFQKKLIMSWALPVETVMLSTMEHHGSIVTAAYIYEGEIAQKLPASAKDFMTTFFTIPYEGMNADYFRYDTSRQYEVIKIDQLK